MQEALLQYIWKHSLFEKQTYKADTGELITIESTGLHNTDGGPDFSNAKVRIDGTVWAGNIEIHVNTSDWTKHGHNKNAAYNNVILHVSDTVDTECYTSNKRRIPCIELKFNRSIEEKYNKLLKEEHAIACHESLSGLNTSLTSFWLSALSVERLLEKSEDIKVLLDYTTNHWEEAFYIHLARSFGLKVNTLPMELLAKSIPLKILAKHSGNLYQLEALFFGQAGFLDETPKDDYQGILKKEYDFLKAKYSLKGLDIHIWKFLRLRPANFPTIRIAEFCSLIHKSKSLLSKILECTDIRELKDLLSAEVSDYWKKHFVFGSIAVSKIKSI